MSDLTRDEIREACEAVGWKWVETEYQAWAERTVDGGDGESYFLLTKDIDHPGTDILTCENCNALALLEATGEEFEISYLPGARWPYAVRKLALTNGPDLTTAAVRAVNQWAKTKKETTP